MSESSTRKKYAVVGTGGRAVMFLRAIAGVHKDDAELVGMCDISQVRMDYYNDMLAKEYEFTPVPTYKADDFDKMVAESKPDVVIVTTMDSLHHKYIIRAMELGCDAISEKPLTIDADKANAILDTVNKTGRDLRVTFNYRYAPHVSKVKELLMSGVIGKPLAVDFSWVLDTSHGADYFRRWHAKRENSGGLLVHKSTHHFDLVNWWLDARPETVIGMGDLQFYGAKAAAERGEKYDYGRYTDSEAAKKDPFYLDINSSETTTALYGEKSVEDSGYIRDQNVFGDHVDIDDTMAVLVRYDNRVIMNYSLIAYCPWEGLRASITGTKGRIELFDQHGSHVILGQSDEELAKEQAKGHEQKLTVFPMFGKPYDVEIVQAEGGHGGGDPLILEQLFSKNPPADPLHRAANHFDGVSSLLIGISANKSIKENSQPVLCKDMVDIPATQEAVAV